MPNYSATLIGGGGLLGSLGRSQSLVLPSSSIVTINKSSSICNVQTTGLNFQGNIKGISQLITNASLLKTKSLLSALFNNGFNQDLNNIYLSKSALGLPAGLNLSLEALFVALLIQWANNIGLGSEARVQAQWLSYGDLNEEYLYFTIQVTFKKALTVVDDYEIQPTYTISPLDF